MTTWDYLRERNAASASPSSSSPLHPPARGFQPHFCGNSRSGGDKMGTDAAENCRTSTAVNSRHRPITALVVQCGVTTYVDAPFRLDAARRDFFAVALAERAGDRE